MGSYPQYGRIPLGGLYVFYVLIRSETHEAVFHVVLSVSKNFLARILKEETSALVFELDFGLTVHLLPKAHCTSFALTSERTFGVLLETPDERCKLEPRKAARILWKDPRFKARVLGHCGRTKEQAVRAKGALSTTTLECSTTETPLNRRTLHRYSYSCARAALSTRMVTSVSNVSLFLMGLAICNVLLAFLTPVTLVLADSCDSLLACSLVV